MNERNIPDNPLEFIKRCIIERKIMWTYHVNMRMEKRFIQREEILNSFHAFEIIESYPDDKYFPSYLVFSEYAGKCFHIVIATDVEGDNIRIVTAYIPMRINGKKI